MDVIIADVKVPRLLCLHNIITVVSFRVGTIHRYIDLAQYAILHGRSKD